MHGFDEFLWKSLSFKSGRRTRNFDYPGNMVLKNGQTFREKFGPERLFTHGQQEATAAEDTGPLTKKRMETVDYETLAEQKDLSRKTRSWKTLFTCWNGYQNAL
jgi:hypothetical protein